MELLFFKIRFSLKSAEVEKSIVLFSYNQTKSVQKRNNQPANGKEMNVLRVSFAYIILFWKMENGKKRRNVKGTDRVGGCLQTGRPHITLPLSLSSVCRVRTTHAECPWPDTHTHTHRGGVPVMHSIKSSQEDGTREGLTVCVYTSHDNWPLAYFWMPMCSKY